MQEFSSVTASSYDADSLTPLLNDKAAEGWSVVSIVTAGTSIVAYLQRESDGTPDMSVADTSGSDMTTADEAVDEPVTETADEAAVDAPYVPVAAAPESPVEEPAGWATAPDDSTTVGTDSTAADDDSIAALAAQVSEPEAVTPVVEAPIAATAPAAEAAPAADAVPAGWYADPSGRFELRYWDGAAWTEHVSRAGQQFTDPPVA